MNNIAMLVVLGLALAQSSLSIAQTTTDDATTRPPTAAQPDNTKSNKVDETNRVTTAQDQSNSPADIELTKKIRQSVVADDSLSTYAHNVKIVTVNGHVTLNGVVRSEPEKASIEKKAYAIAGQAQVTSQLKVASAGG